MAEYDFKYLNDKDFERLLTDLLSLELGIRFERFKPGRDLGVDGRYFAGPDEVILQCKHWARSSVAALIAALKATEYAKIARLKPKRYLLATSLELSRHNKKEIAAALAPYIHSETDILGNEDVNDLLNRHPSVERNHYKLWISSTTVLTQILHASILGRSEFLLSEMREKAKLFVPHPAGGQAIKILEEHGVVLLSGEPGIGKTTLAQQLALLHVSTGYQLCVIADAIEEAEALFHPTERQLFYFDDFLGRNYLSALGRHEDSHIVSFISRVSRDKTKRFILTSRSTILNQGKRISDLFTIENIQKNELEIRISAMEPYGRARLLYNHIWFSNLQPEYIKQILQGKRYREIITHKNFNPRLISFITSAARLTDVPANEYWNYIARTLNNPSELWEHTYESQLDDFGRSLLHLIVYDGGKISETSLRSSYANFLAQETTTHLRGVSDYDQNMKVLVGSLLNRTVDGRSGDAAYSLFNPSVADYVLKKTRNDAPLLKGVFSSFRTAHAVRALRTLLTNKVVDQTTAMPVILAMVENHLPHPDCDLAYKAEVAALVLTVAKDHQRAIQFVAGFINSIDRIDPTFPRWASLATALNVCLSQKLVESATVRSLMLELERATNLDEEDLSAVSYLPQLLSESDSVAVEAVVRRLICARWSEWMPVTLREDEGIQRCLSTEEFWSIAQDTVGNILSDYGLEFSDDNIDVILSGCDAHGTVEKNRRHVNDQEDDRRPGHYYHSGGYSAVSQPDEIDDLFRTDFPPQNSD